MVVGQEEEAGRVLMEAAKLEVEEEEKEVMKNSKLWCLRGA